MKIIYLTANSIIEQKNLVLCLGFFDGVHLAHQKLMDKTIELAKENQIPSALMTFSDYIMAHIRHERFYYLSSLQDKMNKAIEKGFDYFYVLEVSPELISLPAETFIEHFL
ncbi:MAG: bifunctional riboflavin kinase/FMN adenylyltransferase, partial [Candidatus Izemoplasmatales bacterium]